MSDDRSAQVRARPDFDDFFEAEYRRVVGLAAVLVGRTPVAEDLAQEAFVAAYRHWGRVADYDDPAAWVRRVVVNRATSALRRRTREVRALARLSRRPDDRALGADPLPVDDDFWAEVRALPRRQAQCVALRYLEDRPVREIAEVLGIAEPTVRVHLAAGRATLAERLGTTLDEEGVTP